MFSETLAKDSRAWKAMQRTVKRIEAGNEAGTVDGLSLTAIRAFGALTEAMVTIADATKVLEHELGPES